MHICPLIIYFDFIFALFLQYWVQQGTFGYSILTKILVYFSTMYPLLLLFYTFVFILEIEKTKLKDNPKIDYELNLECK